MDQADDLRALLSSVRALEAERERQARELAELRAHLAALVDLLIARGALAEGHKKTLARATSAPSARPVRLRAYVDKYAVVGPDIDCAARLHLCLGRCCRMKVELTAHDVEEGKLLWTLDEPYILRREADGQCTHLDRTTGGCTVYGVRPATCREYDCRKDPRVWTDFERRIPAPMPASLDWPA